MRKSASCHMRDNRKYTAKEGEKEEEKESANTEGEKEKEKVKHRAQVDQVSAFSFIRNNNCMFSEVINDAGNGIPSGLSQAQGQAGPLTLHLHE